MDARRLKPFPTSKMDVPIPAPAEREVRSVIKFLNAQGIAPIEIDRQLCQVYGHNVMSKQMVRCSIRSLERLESSEVVHHPVGKRYLIGDALVAERQISLGYPELYGAETWTLRRSEEKRLEAFEMWIWRRVERKKWTDRIRNEAVLERVGKERMILKMMRKRKRNCLSHWLRRNCLLEDALEGMVNGRRVRGRIKYQMIDDIKVYESYEETKRKAENRKDWRMLGLQ
ncbi:hypothetical protein ANN_09256 [Periplaneta americana]|uniref:Uncharacterized protein n=1 Tax=Periplaneta americana TaxID=6978 RepID=A0ABQ8TL67_PERAM|nr:hypothetical protein ANN_09256 [Periplaneta americana]